MFLVENLQRRIIEVDREYDIIRDPDFHLSNKEAYLAKFKYQKFCRIAQTLCKIPDNSFKDEYTPGIVPIKERVFREISNTDFALIAPEDRYEPFGAAFQVFKQKVIDLRAILGEMDGFEGGADQRAWVDRLTIKAREGSESFSAAYPQTLPQLVDLRGFWKEFFELKNSIPSKKSSEREKVDVHIAQIERKIQEFQKMFRDYQSAPPLDATAQEGWSSRFRDKEREVRWFLNEEAGCYQHEQYCRKHTADDHQKLGRCREGLDTLLEKIRNRSIDSHRVLPTLDSPVPSTYGALPVMGSRVIERKKTNKTVGLVNTALKVYLSLLGVVILGLATVKAANFYDPNILSNLQSRLSSV